MAKRKIKPKAKVIIFPKVTRLRHKYGVTVNGYTHRVTNNKAFAERLAKNKQKKVDEYWEKRKKTRELNRLRFKLRENTNKFKSKIRDVQKYGVKK